MFVHYRLLIREEEHVAAHGISETFERSQVPDVLVIRFEDRGNPMLTHQHLCALDALPAHAVRVETLLPIRCFRTKS